MDRWGQIHVDLRTYGEVFTLQMWVITICNILLRRCVIYFKILYAKGSDYYTASVSKTNRARISNRYSYNMLSIHCLILRTWKGSRHKSKLS